jgi:hypothetical protein
MSNVLSVALERVYGLVKHNLPHLPDNKMGAVGERIVMTLLDSMKKESTVGQRGAWREITGNP